MRSITDLNAIGKPEGWRLVEFIENGTARIQCGLLSLGKSHHDVAERYVIERAKTGSEPHKEALQLVLLSRMPAKPKPKRTRK